MAVSSATTRAFIQTTAVAMTVARAVLIHTVVMPRIAPTATLGKASVQMIQPVKSQMEFAVMEHS